MIRVLVPVRTRSQNGSYGHWAANARMRKTQRQAVHLWLGNRASELRGHEHYTITLTRLAPSGGMDDDNLRAALKSIRDGVTDCLGMTNDRDPRLEWRYAQKPSGKRGVFAVEVLIEWN